MMSVLYWKSSCNDQESEAEEKRELHWEHVYSLISVFFYTDTYHFVWLTIVTGVETNDADLGAAYLNLSHKHRKGIIDKDVFALSIRLTPFWHIKFIFMEYAQLQ